MQDITEFIYFYKGNPHFKGVVDIFVSYYSNIATVLFFNKSTKEFYTKEFEFKPYIYLHKSIIKDITSQEYKKYNVDIDTLITNNIPRLTEGYSIILKTKKSYNNILNLFRYKNIDIYGKDKHLFYSLPLKQQFINSYNIKLLHGIEEEYVNIPKAFMKSIETKNGLLIFLHYKNKIKIFKQVKELTQIVEYIKKYKIYLLIGYGEASMFADIKKIYKTIITLDVKESNEKVHKIFKKYFPNNTKYVILLKENNEKKVLLHPKSNTKIKKIYLTSLFNTYKQMDLDMNSKHYSLSNISSVPFADLIYRGGTYIWNNLMTKWSYQKNIAIPIKEGKKDFSGGISSSFAIGYAENIHKVDYKSWYPSIILDNNIQSNVDIYNVVRYYLLIFRKEREKNKNNKIYADAYKRISNILFGSLGSVYYNWNDYNCASQITNIGRRYLKSAYFFLKKQGYTPLLCDTDGIHFSTSLYDNIIVKDVIQEFNDTIMKDKTFMKINYEECWEKGFFVMKKNYILYKDNKIELKGSALTSKTQSHYINSFIKKQAQLLIQKRTYDFVENYYATLKKIYFREINPMLLANTATINVSHEYYLQQVSLPNIIKDIFFNDIFINIKNIHENIFNYYNNRFIYIKDNWIELINNNNQENNTYIQSFIQQLKSCNHFKSFILYIEKTRVEKNRLYRSIKDIHGIILENYKNMNNGVLKNRIGYIEGILDCNEKIIKNKKIKYISIYNKGICSYDVITGEPYIIILSKNDKEIKYDTAKYIDFINSKMELLIHGFNHNVRQSLITTKPQKRNYYTTQDLALTLRNVDTM